MTKKEAITEMQRGVKITHRFFSSNEWMTMKNNKIVLEDGVKCSPLEFWQWRKNNKGWDDGYSICIA